MSKFLFVLASTVTLAIVSPAVAQYVFTPPGVRVSPWYGFSPWYGISPWYTAPGYTNRGYMWREQRFYIDPRTNNAVQERQNYEQPRTLNNFGVTNPNAGPGECAIGFSEETCRRRGQRYNPPRQN